MDIVYVLYLKFYDKTYIHVRIVVESVILSYLS